MSMARSPLMMAAVMLWLLLVLILLLMGQHMLRACGIGFFGYSLSWCETSAATPGALRRQQGLSVELAALERQYRALPLCRLETPQGGAGSAPGSAVPGLSPQPNGASTVPAGPPPAGGGGSLGAPVSPMPTPVPGAAPPTSGSVPGSGSDTGRGDGEGDRDGAAEGGNSRAQADANPRGGNGDGDACQPDTQDRAPVLLAIDHSRSMALPVDMDDGAAVELEALMDRNTPAGWAAKKIYDGYVDQPGRKRLDALKDVLTRSIEALPPGNTVGLVTFGGCRGVVDAGLFGDDKRGDLVARIQSLKPVPATPVAEALQAALTRAKSAGNGRIVLVTDGRDTCGGDPCATARRNGGVRVDVLAIAGGRELTCIAEATGGKMIDASGTAGIDDEMSQLIAGEQPSCR